MILGKKISVKIFKKKAISFWEDFKNCSWKIYEFGTIWISASEDYENKKCINNLKYLFSKSFIKNVSKKYKFLIGEFL